MTKPWRFSQASTSPVLGGCFCWIQTFRLLVPLPDGRDNYILGDFDAENQVLTVEVSSGSNAVAVREWATATNTLREV